MRKLGIYIHIPFCLRKCNYCDFFSLAEMGKVDRYIDELVEEIVGARLGAPVIADTIFFGGGTPSVLSAAQLERIMTAIRNKFEIDENAEITIEVNPATGIQDLGFSSQAILPISPSAMDKVGFQDFAGLAKIGFNRISFGLQSANNNELKALGRLHTYEQFVGEFELARKHFDNVNIDLIYGIPEQTVASWERTLRLAGKLAPEHISAYSLIIEPGTPFYDMNLDLPSEEEVCAMQAMIREILPQHFQYEISNYALDGYECRHNLKYWEMGEYVGFGAGAHSFLSEKLEVRSEKCGGKATHFRFENSKHLSNWEQRKIEVDYLSEYMFLGLRKIEGVEILPEINVRFGEIINNHIKNKMMIKEGNRLRLTPRGMDISNIILSDFV
ncbi:MAG: coproporphyrinogen III oxidase family protein [Oscillospiraceae bacterium]|nr:coproporphyrinogen III oxidase family protein [Oscillospiraceae bacterium]